jgi:hypothetical protein
MTDALHEVLQLLGQQSYAIDEGDASGWAATFTEDGTFSSPTYGEPVRGRTDLTAFAARHDSAVAGRHVLTGTHLVRTHPGGDECDARSTLLIVAPVPDGDARILRITTMDDHLVRVDGRLLVQRRQVTPH